MRPSLHAAERGARHAAAGDEEARNDVERLALARDAAHRREAPRLARGLDGLPHDGDVAGRLERVVGAEAAGLRADPVDRVVARGPRVRGAVTARFREPVLGEVDGDDALCAGEPAADDGSQADEAAAEDGADGAGLDLAP